MDDEIERFLTDLEPPIRDLAREVVDCVGRRLDLQAKVRWGWRSVNFHHASAGLVCAVFPLNQEVRLVFEHGRLLSNESGLLEGTQRQIRSIFLRPGSPVPTDAIGLLLAESIALRA